MENIFANTLMVILTLLVYILGPILLIKGLKKWKKHRRLAPPKKYKLISIPLLFLNAVPAFVLTLQEQGFSVGNDEIWEMLMFIFFVVEAVITLVECRWNGIWICVVRFIAGTCMGVLAGVAFVIFLALVVIIGCGLASVREITINRNGQEVKLHSTDEEGKVYYDPKTGETFLVENRNMVVSKVNGSRYSVY